MKIAATASYNAVPSMLIVAPMGSTNLFEIKESNKSAQIGSLSLLSQSILANHWALLTEAK